MLSAFSLVCSAHLALYNEWFFAPRVTCFGKVGLDCLGVLFHIFSTDSALTGQCNGAGASSQWQSWQRPQQKHRRLDRERRRKFLRNCEPLFKLSGCHLHSLCCAHTDSVESSVSACSIYWAATCGLELCCRKHLVECECLFVVQRCWRPRLEQCAGKGSAADVPDTGLAGASCRGSWTNRAQRSGKTFSRLWQ